jgi:hypothetical protein
MQASTAWPKHAPEDLQRPHYGHSTAPARAQHVTQQEGGYTSAQAHARTQRMPSRSALLPRPMGGANASCRRERENKRAPRTADIAACVLALTVDASSTCARVCTIFFIHIHISVLGLGFKFSGLRTYALLRTVIQIQSSRYPVIRQAQRHVHARPTSRRASWPLTVDYAMYGWLDYVVTVKWAGKADWLVLA